MELLAFVLNSFVFGRSPHSNPLSVHIRLVRAKHYSIYFISFFFFGSVKVELEGIVQRQKPERYSLIALASTIQFRYLYLRMPYP